MPEQTEMVIVAYGRTAYAKAKKGSLRAVHPVDFGAQALAGVVGRVQGLPAARIDDVIVGCAMPFGVQGWNIGRLLVQRAGFPDSVSAQTVNRFCSSGLQALALANNGIRCGEEQVIVAGGVESMSLVPMAPDPNTFEPWLVSHAPEAYMAMGITAENVAERYKINRADMEAFAVESHLRAAKATSQGWFKSQILPVTYVDSGGIEQIFDTDEGIRPETTAEGLAALQPCFKENGVVTAATSSQMSDGASFLVMMSAAIAAELGAHPIARMLSYATAGVPAEIMGTGPIAAVPKVLAKAGLSLGDMDIIELNEAFASQALACVRALDMDPARVNPWGGALALGHPLGATGAMLACKALAYLEHTQKRFGMVTMCIGGGMGAAGIFERIEHV
jgi:acetyl-CoA acyltransferase